MLRNKIIVAAISAFFALNTAQVIAAEMLTKLGKGEGQVDIVAWPGYIERGETDASFDWVTKFENSTGCKVNVKTANTSDEMVALMNEGGFDLVTASGDASLRLVAGKRVQPVNVNLVPSWNTVDKRLQNAPWHTVDGVHYGVPYMWGPNVLMYDTRAFKKAPDSWSVVFEETMLDDGKSNMGRVQAYDGPIHVADAANYLMYHRKDLGIKNPYELSEDQYKGRSIFCGNSVSWCRATGTMLSSRWMISRTRVSSLRDPGRSRSTCCRPTNIRLPRPFPWRAPPGGPIPR